MKRILILMLFIICLSSTAYGLTGYWEDDLVAVAREEIGYEESRTDYRNVGLQQNGYTKYGHWYGYDYMDWCVCFVSYCAEQAKIPLDLRAGSIGQLINLGKEYNSYFSASIHKPEKGDIFFRTADDPYAIRERIIRHCGIVEDVNDTVLYTIEGNVDGKVVRKAYFLGDPVISSYISIWELMKAGGIPIVERNTIQSEEKNGTPSHPLKNRIPEEADDIFIENEPDV